MTTLTLVTYIDPKNVTAEYIRNNTFDHVVSHALLWADQDAIAIAYDKYHTVGFYAFNENWELVSVCKPH